MMNNDQAKMIVSMIQSAEGRMEMTTENFLSIAEAQSVLANDYFRLEKELREAKKSVSIFDKATGISADLEYRRCAFAHTASNYMSSWEGLKISPSKMEQILGSDFDEEVANYLYDPSDDNMDTCVRENVMDHVAMHYLQKSWPTYGDRADMGLFMNQLYTAVNKDQ